VTQADLLALGPFLALTAGAMVLTLVIALKRDHGLAALTAAASLVAALGAIGPSLDVAPRAVTALVRIDAMGLLFCGLFLVTALATVPLSWRYLEPRRGVREEFHLLLLLATLGAMTLAVATHFASLLLGLEILSIALYPLIAYPERGRKPLEAALKYLVLSGAASSMLLFGMALIYADTGALTFADVAARSTEQGGGLLFTLGALLLFTGLAFKLSLVPFHMWTPDVYQGAPAPAAAYLATVGKAAVIALVLRLVLGTGLLADDALFTVLSLIAGLSMIVGNLLALQQPSVKRMLAYSSIAHLGYLLVAVLALETAADHLMAAEALIVYAVAYVVMTFGAFAIIAVLSAETLATERAAEEDSTVDFDADALTHYAGLFWRRPWVATVFTAMLLSLAGIPLTAGFIAKFYLFAAGVDARLWVLLWLLVIGSGIGLFYYLRLVFTMTRDPEPAANGPSVEADARAEALSEADALQGSWLLGGLLFALLLIGIHPAPLIELVRAALGG
jgi:NADH-quinone oxidoreductase subunit N